MVVQHRIYSDKTIGIESKMTGVLRYAPNYALEYNIVRYTAWVTAIKSLRSTQILFRHFKSHLLSLLYVQLIILDANNPGCHHIVELINRMLAHTKHKRLKAITAIQFVHPSAVWYILF